MENHDMNIPSPEELRYYLDREYMAKESILHDIERFFNELPKEHLITFRLMVHYMVEEIKLAAYYEGVASQTLVLKHHVCGGCGKNHDEALDVIPTDAEYTESLRLASSIQDEGTKGGTQISPNIITEMIELSPEDIANMKLYNLDDARNEKTLELMGFICTKCGLLYQSIADRMLRPPDHCDGCFQKAKFG